MTEYLLFSLFYIFSFFALFHSTRPFAESFSVLYQAVFLVSLIHLAAIEGRAVLKSVLVIGLSLLLCIAGKMNYFFIAAPAVVLYPFIDGSMRAAGSKIKYYLTALIALVVPVAVLACMKFDFLFFINFMVTGDHNYYGPMKVIGSLFGTFHPKNMIFIINRTIGDFGLLLFTGGVVGFMVLARRFIRILSNGGAGAEGNDRYNAALFILMAGHCVNYFFLKNIYAAHNYYLFSVFPLFILAAVIAVKAGWEALRNNASKKVYIFALASCLSVTALYPLLSEARSFFSLQLIRGAAVSAAIDGRTNFGHWILHTISSLDAFSTKAGYPLLAALTAFSIGVLFGIAVLINRILRRRNGSASANVPFLLCVAVIGFLFISTAFKNAYDMYWYHSYFGKVFPPMVETAKKLTKLTAPGEVVMSRGTFIVFYTDRLYCTPPENEKDVALYRQKEIRYLLGEPAQTMKRYFEKVDEGIYKLR
ncbi:MAG: hypothetical protein AABZ39_09340 [Spirochaetota bacterium]